MCSAHGLGRQSPARRKDKGDLHGKDRVPGRGREEHRQWLGELQHGHGYKAGINAVLANTANVTAHGGTPTMTLMATRSPRPSGATPRTARSSW